jgi:hypothetical protein
MSGRLQISTSGSARLRAGLASFALWLGLFALAVTAAGGVYVLRGHAAAACDMLERGGALVLTFFAVLLLGVNVVLGTGLWVVLHRQGGHGVAGAVVLGLLLFVVTGLLSLAFTCVPEGYPTPTETCPGGEPPWWPSFLPG